MLYFVKANRVGIPVHEFVNFKYYTQLQKVSGWETAVSWILKSYSIINVFPLFISRVRKTNYLIYLLKMKLLVKCV